jgi:di/tricarboxylate transporter
MQRPVHRLLVIFLVPVLITVVFAFLSARAVAQCAMCARSLESGADSSPGALAQGFYWSILFLLGVLFTLAGVVAALVLLEARRPSAARSAGGQESTPGSGAES